MDPMRRTPHTPKRRSNRARKRTQQQKPTGQKATDAVQDGLTTVDPASKNEASSKNAAAKAAPKARYARTYALRDALVKDGTREEITRHLDRLYQDNGGSPNPSGARAMVSLHALVLKHFGVIQEDEDGNLSLKQ